jgi:hypothetical protein
VNTYLPSLKYMLSRKWSRARANSCDWVTFSRPFPPCSRSGARTTRPSCWSARRGLLELEILEGHLLLGQAQRATGALGLILRR